MTYSIVTSRTTYDLDTDYQTIDIRMARALFWQLVEDSDKSVNEPWIADICVKAMLMFNDKMKRRDMLSGVKEDITEKPLREALLEFCIEAFDTTEENVMSKSRKHQECAFPRFVYFKLCKMKTKDSLENIGKPFGKHHCSVLHGINMVDQSAESFRMSRHADKLYEGYAKARAMLNAYELLKEKSLTKKEEDENLQEATQQGTENQNLQEGRGDAIPDGNGMHDAGILRVLHEADGETEAVEISRR